MKYVTSLSNVIKIIIIIIIINRLILFNSVQLRAVPGTSCEQWYVDKPTTVFVPSRTSRQSDVPVDLGYRVSVNS